MKSNLRSEKRKVQKGLWILREIDKYVSPSHIPFIINQVQSAYLILLRKGTVIVVTHFKDDRTANSIHCNWTSIRCPHPVRDFQVIRNYYKQVDITEIMVEISLGVLPETVHVLWRLNGNSKADIFLWEKRQEF